MSLVPQLSLDTHTHAHTHARTHARTHTHTHTHTASGPTTQPGPQTDNIKIHRGLNVKITMHGNMAIDAYFCLRRPNELKE